MFKGLLTCFQSIAKLSDSLSEESITVLPISSLLPLVFTLEKRFTFQVGGVPLVPLGLAIGHFSGQSFPGELFFSVVGIRRRQGLERCNERIE